MIAAAGMLVTSAGQILVSREAPTPTSDNDLLQQYCVRCHNDRPLRGNMSLEGFDAGSPQNNGELAEKVIVKLRAGMMPPPGSR